MRIRNSKVLFPSSLSTTVPLSDPNLINRSPVVVQLNDAIAIANTTHHAASAASQAASSLDRYQPFGQTIPPIRKPSNGCDDDDDDDGDLSGIGESGAYRQHNKQGPLEEDDGRRQESGDLGEKGNSLFRKGSILGAAIAAHQVVQSSRSTSSTQDGRWCEGEKGIPLKKRRGGFENDGDDGNSKKMKAPKMKTKMNKKCSTTQNDNDNDKDWEEEEERPETKADHHHHVNNNNNNVGKKRAKGSAVMEGSRCSRVNGRGWRCCQQTLVGYSLCEHHLGKGRLRSMTSVRNRSSITSSSTTADKKKKKKKKVHDDEDGLLSEPLGASSFPEKRTKCVSDDDPLVNDEKKEVIVSKRRMKLGMVKARSISSLLGQTNTAVAHEDNN
ncbi:hypothetical protein RIF29_25161 [Crotalaria pallida]|uniref:WRC domain-containing protein n=1 Tax=Crotalaria pallida TaxID=3830 RepID=A0AAN9HZ20_CROPI